MMVAEYWATSNFQNEIVFPSRYEFQDGTFRLPPENNRTWQGGQGLQVDFSLSVTAET